MEYIDPKIIERIKESLQEYFVNEVKLPMGIMLHSFALIDMVIFEEGEKAEYYYCHDCRKKITIDDYPYHNSNHSMEKMEFIRLKKK